MSMLSVTINAQGQVKFVIAEGESLQGENSSHRKHQQPCLFQA